MSQERRERAESPAIRQLWEITKPENPQHAEYYLQLLHDTVRIPKQYRFERPFQRPKKSGNGSRTIVPAAEPLRTTQYFLANWIRDNLPQGQDYCYTGRKVNAALEAHRESNYALVCDLKDAFDQVTEQKIKNWFSLYDHRLRGEPLNVMTDLLTYRGRAPQGCRTTAFTYNVVISEMDRYFDVIAPPLGIEKWTRYSDNICLSAKNEINFTQVHDQVKRVAKGFGFELSWDRPFVGNIEYLGARITGGNIFIPDEKVGELADRIFDWLESDNPQEHYHQALGILTWARGLSGPNVSSYLLDMLNIYFKEVEKPSEVERIMGKAYGRLI